MPRKGYNYYKKIEEKQNFKRKLIVNTFKFSIITFIVLFSIYIIYLGTNYSYKKIVEILKNSSSFKIEEIIVKGNEIIPSEEIIYKANLDLGISIFDINIKALEKNILTIDRIKKVFITKKYPNKIEIYVVEKIPIAYVYFNNKIMFLSDDGSLIEIRENESPDLPIVRFDNIDNNTPIKLKQIILNKVVEFIDTTKIVNYDLLNKISEIKIDKNGNFTIYINKGMTKVIIGNEKLYEKLLSLNGLINQYDFEVVNYKYIDLRFDNLAFAK